MGSCRRLNLRHDRRFRLKMGTGGRGRQQQVAGYQRQIFERTCLRNQAHLRRVVRCTRNYQCHMLALYSSDELPVFGNAVYSVLPPYDGGRRIDEKRFVFVREVPFQKPRTNPLSVVAMELSVLKRGTRGQTEVFLREAKKSDGNFMPHSIAIIGAGMTGLAAARTLTGAGHSVTLYEKSRSVGGRVATRRVEGCIFDHGAQVIKPDGTELADVMFHQLPTEDLIEILAPTRPYADDGTILPPDPARNAERKFSYRTGMTALPKLLLQALPPTQTTLRCEARIAGLEQDGAKTILRGENGEEMGRADYVLLTAPAPQSADLLAASRLRENSASRIEALRSVPYHPCLTVLLGFAPPAPAPPAYALLAENRARPLLWLAFEQTKCPERAPNGEALLIAQFGPQWSAENYALPDAEVITQTHSALRPLFGPQYDTTRWAQVKRWRYSQPRGMTAFDAANSESSPVIVCGDGLRPENGRVVQAYASGLEAARFVMQQSGPGA